MSSNEVLVVPHFERQTHQSWRATVLGVGRAAYTLFNVPDHDSSLYEELATILNSTPQPLVHSIDDEVRGVVKIVSNLAEYEKLPSLGRKDIFGHVGIFMQFTSYLPRLRPFGMTPFTHLSRLHESIVQQGSKTPLGFAQQLEIALNQTQGDLPEAIWRLFLMSRQYGRWFDSGMIPDMPDYSRDEKLELMRTFAVSVRACKPFDQEGAQDSAGDAYYTWTHALGTFVFSALARRQTPTVKLGKHVIQNGTNLMHNLAHRYKAQRLPSDHSIAAQYGNAIGDCIVDVVNQNT